MTYVKNVASSLAKQIAQELDKLDGNPGDGKISSEVWNNVFKAKEKGGNEIKSYISIFNAEKSIQHYLNKVASNNDVNEVGNSWLESLKPKADEADAKEAEQQKTVSDAPSVEPTPIVAQPVSTAVHTMREIVVVGDASVSKRAKEAMAKLNDNATQIREITDLIKQELAKKGINESKVDIPYWAERIARVSSKFSIPKEIIVSIISKETVFAKNISNKNGKGAMALTGIAIRSFFPTGQGNWNDVYQQLDKDLLDDILYQKDQNGNFVADSKGKPVLKYKSAEELLTACGKDDELSMKVGSLIFEMKYAEAVARKKFGRSTYANVPRAIAQLKSGEITLSENENTACVADAVKNYNGCDTIVKRHGKLVAIKDDYKRDVMDSLKVQGYNFAEQNIIKRS